MVNNTMLMMLGLYGERPLPESLHDVDDAGEAVSSWPAVLLAGNADAAGVVG